MNEQKKTLHRISFWFDYNLLTFNKFFKHLKSLTTDHGRSLAQMLLSLNVQYSQILSDTEISALCRPHHHFQDALFIFNMKIALNGIVRTVRLGCCPAAECIWSQSDTTLITWWKKCLLVFLSIQDDKNLYQIPNCILPSISEYASTTL